MFRSAVTPVLFALVGAVAACALIALSAGVPGRTAREPARPPERCAPAPRRSAAQRCTVSAPAARPVRVAFGRSRRWAGAGALAPKVSART
jgi:hypothetical protein